MNHKHGVCSIGNMTFNFSILFDDGDKISFNSSFGHLQDENIQDISFNVIDWVVQKHVISFIELEEVCAKKLETFQLHHNVCLQL